MADKQSSMATMPHGVMKAAYTLWPRAVEVLRYPEPDEPVTLYCLGLDVTIHLAPLEARRVAEDILAALEHNQESRDDG